ncbi:MAG: 23S rRNA (uracil(1939)-C(5))-methyltransferase RlmD [Oscillospiraceae bacterium]|nr:23S rRNA (uracil(1939)-C(5))-methyltransferase RlmD [Oscillospiraceae bacterium]
MLKVGQVERTEITGYSSEGMGICRIDGCAVFVPNAIRGELCEIKVTHVSRNSAHGKIEQIIERSPHRITRTCPDAKRCGGCQLHHMDYAEELAFKAQKVTDALNRIGSQNIPLVKITGADGTVSTQGAESELQKEGAPAAAFAYRNKAQYPVAEQEGKPVAGFYKNRTHEVIPVKRCAILPEIFDRVRDVVVRWAAEDRVSVYNEHSGKGLLRHIYVRKGTISGQLMVCLVVNGKTLPREQRLVNTLRREIPGLASVVLSVNTKNTNVVLGEEIRTLWGEPFIEDQLCGFTFRLSPHSFYQVNHDQAQRLYAKAVELAALHGTETVLDLYCGTGTITLALSREAGRAIGVEVIPQAIEDAKENALRNGVQNVEFFCADAGEAAQRFASQASGIGDQAFGDEKAVTGHLSPVTAHGSSPDVILVDPPRKGLAPEVIDAVVTMAPKRVVYVSCDPATLARDVKLFSERGYSLSHAEAFDLFPRTFHVETVVQLVRKNPDMAVCVTVNLEDADLTAAESKATYEQIKDYALNTYGFQVTSLQIAQTKRKLGLPTGDHYNLSQKENQVIPQCPPEKENAIREALRHFRMLN